MTHAGWPRTFPATGSMCAHLVSLRAAASRTGSSKSFSCTMLAIRSLRAHAAGVRLLARQCNCRANHGVTRPAAAAAAAMLQAASAVGSSNRPRRQQGCRRSGPAVPRAAASTAAAAATMPAVNGEQQQQVVVPPLTFAHRAGVWDSEGRVSLKNLTLPELCEWTESLGHDSKRALQLWRAMYGDGRWVRSLDACDGEPQPFAAAFKAAVAAAGSLSGGLTLQSATTARDGTHKLVFALHGGGASSDAGAPLGNVETVLIPMKNRDGSQLRYTACLSSQVGCAMNCQFCYTGRMGLLANLSTAQMVEQLVEARRWLADYTRQQQQQEQQLQHEMPPLPEQAQQVQQQQHNRGSRGRSKRGNAWPRPPPRIGNIVFMGMGEPLHNMEALLPALDIICHPQGLGLSRAKVIVSTVGLVPQLRQLRASGKAKLAVSLHATTDEVRSWIVPTNRKYPLDQLLGALRELYPLPAKRNSDSSSSSGGNTIEVTASSGSQAPPTSSSSSPISSASRLSSGGSDDFVVIEYVLLKGVNDSDDDAARLLELLADVYCMVNLIVFNPHEGTRFERSEDEQVQRFRQIVMQGGKVCTLRVSKGDDSAAACGQLGNPELSPRPAPLLKPPARLRAVLPGAAAAAAAAE